MKLTPVLTFIAFAPGLEGLCCLTFRDRAHNLRESRVHLSNTDASTYGEEVFFLTFARGHTGGHLQLTLTADFPFTFSSFPTDL